MKNLSIIFISLFFINIGGVHAQKIDFTREELKWIKENPVVYFGYDPNWPPYEIYKDGKYIGVCSDFIKIIQKKSGIKFLPLKNLTWEKSLRMLKDNKLMMVPAAAITEERLKDLIFTDNYIKLPWVIVTKKEVYAYKKLEDLNFKTISLPKDYMQYEIIPKEYPKIKIRTRNNFEECLQDVSSGLSDATVGSLGSISYFINETSSNDLKIASYTRYNKDYVAFAFPKEQQVLRDIVQKSLKSITILERNKINSKWVSIQVDNEINFENFWKHIIIVLTIILIVIITVSIWIKSLRRQINLRKKTEDELSKALEFLNKQNDDKTVLLQEIHHRVKNNLQIIISLLRLQSNSNTNLEVQNALNEAIDRINSISLVHEHIYKNPNLAEIQLGNYIQNLGEELKRVFIRDKEIQFDIKTNDVHLDIKTIIPLALILNELITNSLKYAFTDFGSGMIHIHFTKNKNKIEMQYFDTGKWFHNTYTKNFGTYLIDIFTEQLSGEVKKLETENANYVFVFNEF